MANMPGCLLMRLLAVVLLFQSLLPAVAESAEFNATDWTRELTAVNYMNRDATILFGGPYALKDVDIKNGRIEFDVSMHGQRGFVGLVFRYQSQADFELFYWRPHKSLLPDAMQYAPSFNGMTTWQLYSEGYMAATEMPHNRWVHVVIEFIGTTAKIYMDDRPEPVLTVRDLKHGDSRGSVGLWGGNVAHFSNFKYTAFDDDARSEEPEPVVIAANILKDWQISQVYEATVQPANQIPGDITWQAVDVEPPGFVNVSRYYAKLAREDRLDKTEGKDLIFARTTIESKGQLKKLQFGYSDEIVIFLNGKLLYEGYSAFGYRYPFALGILGTKNDAIYLPLRPGKNELIFAVSEIFGGWGFMANWDP